MEAKSWWTIWLDIICHMDGEVWWVSICLMLFLIAVLVVLVTNRNGG